MSFTEPFAEYEFQSGDEHMMGSWDLDAPVEPFGVPLEQQATSVPTSPATSAVAKRRRRPGATAAMFTALAMAYREVFEPEKRDEIVFEVEADEPLDDQPVQFILEPGNPAASRIVIRRWH